MARYGHCSICLNQSRVTQYRLDRDSEAILLQTNAAALAVYFHWTGPARIGDKRPNTRATRVYRSLADERRGSRNSGRCL